MHVGDGYCHCSRSMAVGASVVPICVWDGGGRRSCGTNVHLDTHRTWRGLWRRGLQNSGADAQWCMEG